MFLSIILLTSSSLMDCVLDSALHDIWVFQLFRLFFLSFNLTSIPGPERSIWLQALHHFMRNRFFGVGAANTIYCINLTDEHWSSSLSGVATQLLARKSLYLTLDIYIHYCGLCHWPKCYHIFNWFFLSKPGFLEFIWIFNSEIISKLISPTFQIQILPNKFH